MPTFLTKGLSKMAGYILYPKKSFPECREQFSFSTDSIDYTIFGGFASRVYGDLWVFDPSTVFLKKNCFSLIRST